jgi:hypothetical protein
VPEILFRRSPYEKGKERGPVHKWKTHITPIVHDRIMADRGRENTLP